MSLPSLPLEAELVTANAHTTASSSLCRVRGTIDRVKLVSWKVPVETESGLSERRGKLRRTRFGLGMSTPRGGRGPRAHDE